ncbi:MAG: hypothetical protein LH468_13295 [Nocardioides sp.]|nr:hypothetical protein [Nocardioides sp.]
MPILRTAARVLLGVFLVVAGVAHFRATESFLGQVPTWLPARTLVVQVSGVVEVGLGLALLVAPSSRRAWVGLAVAALFVAVFPGNVSQLATGTDSFGLDTTTSRVVRLFFQPVLIGWALWCTGAWHVGATRWRHRAAGSRTG